MRRSKPELKKIDYNAPIDRDCFLQLMQHSLLLALRDLGRLTPMQYRYAEEKMKQQRCERAKQKQETL